MNVTPQSDGTFRDEFTFRNSPAAIQRFPLPFPEDRYAYSVNIEEHMAGPKGSVIEFPIDIDEHYSSECSERALVLAENPRRFQTLPHMMSAEWDCLELIMESLARDYPQHFQLLQDGSNWCWRNRLLDLQQQFRFGDPRSLPYSPLEYAARQAQGDWVLLDQRDGDLWADAGMVTTQADWSMEFDLGMSFKEWHGPVPLAHELGVFDRALKFLLNLQINKPVRRLNWTMTVNPRLDTAPESYHRWGLDRTTITAGNIPDKLHLRVELQGLWRLPRSNAVVFAVRCYLLSLRDLVTVPKWARRVHRVLRDLPAELVDYKGLTRYHTNAVEYLAQFDDGRPNTPGTSAQ